MSWKWRTFRLFLIIAAACCALPRVPVSAQETPSGLEEMSVDELMNVEVTSVSRTPQKRSNAAAAVFVITGEDIRRSGVTNIPDALRMVPGLDVGRIDANKWAVSSRGFSGLYANKLLVLVDGRSVYTPLEAGVDWDELDIPLEDIDRIEVIRGPGATMWGANAVNGVINIITKWASDTQGAMVTGGLGTAERYFGGARWGGKIGNNAYYRLYARYFKLDDVIETPAGGLPNRADEWDSLRGGGRVDWKASAKDMLTLEGDIYRGSTGETFHETTLSAPFNFNVTGETGISGGDAVLRWTHDSSISSGFQLQMNFTREVRSSPLQATAMDVYNIDFQHHFTLSKRHEIIWGLNYRFTRDHVDNRSFLISFIPDRREVNQTGVFAQDDIALIEERLHLIIGSKFEYYDYSGIEVEPSGRLIWTSGPHTLWTAVSRAVRMPARADLDLRVNTAVIPGTTPIVMALLGNKGLASTPEKLTAGELGYRVKPWESVFLDIAAFYNVYDPLLEFPDTAGAQFLETTPAPAHIVIPRQRNSNFSAQTYGVEPEVDWTVRNWWRLNAAFTYLHMKVSQVDKDTEGESPGRQLSLRSSMDLPENVELDLWGRYVSSIPTFNVGSYVTLDARLGWRPARGLEISVVGQNLLERSHAEARNSGPAGALPNEVKRSVYGKMTLQF